MLPRITVLISLVFLLFVSSLMFCQVSEATTPDTSAETINNTAHDVLGLLYDNDFVASEHIEWENFIYNSYDYSDDYWDAYDYQEEDYFIADLIDVMSAMLHYDGDTNDEFTDWTSEKEGNATGVMCHNKKKKVIMNLTVNSLGRAFVNEITILNINE